MNVRPIKRLLVATAAVVGMAAFVDSAGAAEPLRKPLAAAIKELAPWFKAKDFREINLVEPRGPRPEFPEGKPAGVRKLVAELLQAEGIKVNPETNAKLLVDYSNVTLDKQGEPIALEIALTVTDPETGASLDRKVAKLTDRLALRALGGLLSSPLELPIATAAKAVAQALSKLGSPEVVLQSVQGPDGLHAGMYHLVLEALRRQVTAKGPVKVSVAAEARLRVTYQLSGKTAKDLEYQFEFELIDARGTEILRHRIKAKVSEDNDPIATLALAAPVTVDTRPDLTDEERIRRYFEKLQNGRTYPCHLEGSEVRVSAQGDYGVEVRVNNQPVRPTLMNGNAVVQFDEGATYELVLHNRKKGYYAAADVRIDGLSMFALRKAPGLNFVGIGPDGGRIPGWFEMNEKYYAFKVGSDDSSPAARMLPTRPDTGTITVTFRAAWTREQDRPADEKRLIAKGPSRSGIMGTTVGDAGKSKYRDVSVYHGEIRETIVIFYGPKKVSN